MIHLVKIEYIFFVSVRKSNIPQFFLFEVVKNNNNNTWTYSDVT